MEESLWILDTPARGNGMSEKGSAEGLGRILLIALVLVVLISLLGVFGCVVSTSAEGTTSPLVAQHPEGKVVDPYTGLWKIYTTGNFSVNIVFGTESSRDEEVPPGAKGAVFDVGPDGLEWVYEFDEWVHITDARRLNNGNYLFVSLSNGTYEITPEGKEVAFIEDPSITHHAEKLENGNYLTVSAVENRVRETTKTGYVVWEWDADKDMQNLPTHSGNPQFFEGLYTSQKTSILGQVDWTHVNYAQRLDNGNTIISLRNFDMVIEISPGKTVLRTFGPLRILKQHTPVYLPESNTLLIFDNGNDRVVEYDWATQEVVWEYGGLNSFAQGSCQRLENGNTLITESYQGRVIEVTPDKRIVATLTTPGFRIYRAFGY